MAVIKFDSVIDSRYSCSIEFDSRFEVAGPMRYNLGLMIITAGLTVTGLLMTGVAQAATIAIEPARASSLSAGFARWPAAAAPRPLDLKLRELPRKVPPRAEKLMVPDLNPLIEQLIRHSDLDAKATKIMPWVYASCTELLVADYEDAVTNLDAAAVHLRVAMHNLVEKSNDSLATDNSIVMARLEMDRAQYTILFLMEMAMHEL